MQDDNKLWIKQYILHFKEENKKCIVIMWNENVYINKQQGMVFWLSIQIKQMMKYQEWVDSL